MTDHPRRSDYSRRLVSDLLNLLEMTDQSYAALEPAQRRALLAAAHDYAALVPESCTRCGQALAYLQPADPSEYSYDRALRIRVAGGYGMFIDPFEQGDPEILLCHACAHAISATLPWFAAAIGADHGHTDGSSADPEETAAWPTLEEAAAMLRREVIFLAPYADLVVVRRDGVARIRPAVMIELARSSSERTPDEVAEDLLSLAHSRAPAHRAVIEAEIAACFVNPNAYLNPESAANFLAAVRRISPEWADRLDVIYGEGGAGEGEARPPA